MKSLHFNSFDEVAYGYNNTKPVQETSVGSARDLRPIARRSRKWERIAKVSDTKYALVDQFFSLYGFEPEMIAEVAPIVWERKEDGDYVSFRNSTRYPWHSRWRFIEAHAPLCIRLCTFGEGSLAGCKEYLEVAGVGQVPLPRMDIGRIRDAADKVIGFRHMSESLVTFKVLPDGKVERANSVRVTLSTVDKEKKRGVRAITKKFFEYILVMEPFALDKAETALGLGCLITKDVGRNTYDVLCPFMDGVDLHAPMLLDAMSDEGSDLRPYIASGLALHFKRHYWHERADLDTVEGVRRARARYNNWCNKALQLFKQETF